MNMNKGTIDLLENLNRILPFGSIHIDRSLSLGGEKSLRYAFFYVLWKADPSEFETKEYKGFFKYLIEKSRVYSLWTKLSIDESDLCLEFSKILKELGVKEEIEYKSIKEIERDKKKLQNILKELN